MKDNFSEQSDQYAKFRPTYPDALFQFMVQHVPGLERAWDCGTGNGQIAAKLAPLFSEVYGTDISKAQLEQAATAGNISYSVQPAEQTQFPDAYFDLVIVGQAVHWFQFDRFYTEVKRVAKPNALVVITGYGRLRIEPELDRLIDHFYYQVVGAYWDAERRYIDEDYQTIPFPFAGLTVPRLSIELQWSFEHLLGYLETWSAVKHYEKAKDHNPVDLVREALRNQWGSVAERTIYFPLLLRAGIAA